MTRPGGRWTWLALGAACCIAMILPARICATTLPNASHLFVGSARVGAGRRLLWAGAAWWGLYLVAVIALLRSPPRAGGAHVKRPVPLCRGGAGAGGRCRPVPVLPRRTAARPVARRVVVAGRPD